MYNPFQLEKGFESKLDFIRGRFPKRAEFLAVLGVTVFVCHGWMLRGFFNELPSLMLYFRFGEILSILAYMMAFALLESLLVTGGIALLAGILPTEWLSTGFAYKGLIVVVLGTIAAIRFQKTLQNVFPAMQTLMLDLLIPLLAMTVLIVVSHFLQPLRKILIDVADRFSIMLYLFVPVGIVSLVVVIFRILI